MKQITLFEFSTEQLRGPDSVHELMGKIAKELTESIRKELKDTNAIKDRRLCDMQVFYINAPDRLRNPDATIGRFVVCLEREFNNDELAPQNTNQYIGNSTDCSRSED